MDRKVWTKASKDSAGLRRYYNNHRQNYMWDERYRGKIYLCDDKKTMKKVKKMKKGGLFRKKHPDSEILKEINKGDQQLEIKEGLFAKGENAIIDHYAWGIGDKKKLKRREPYFVRGEIIPPQVKKLEEVRGEVLADYQNYLEEQWIEELRDKYAVKMNEEKKKKKKKNE